MGRIALRGLRPRDVFRGIQEDPNLVDVRSRGSDHFEELTEATMPGLRLL